MPIEAVRYRDYRGNTVVADPESLVRAAQKDAKFPFPAPFLSSMLENVYSPDRPKFNPREVSVTHVLKGCPRCRVLQAYEGYTVDLDSTIAAWRGTQFHSLMEKHAVPGDVCEARFWAPVPGTEFTVHGKPDILRPRADGTWEILDLKTTQSVPNWDQPWSDHVEQVMVYTWLVRHSADGPESLRFTPESRFTRAVIWYLGDKNGSTVFKPLEVRKKVQVNTQEGSKYSTRTVKVPDIWTDEEIEARLFPKVVDACEAYLEYESSGTLPQYPQGMDIINGFEHRYSPTADMCVRRWAREGGR